MTMKKLRARFTASRHSSGTHSRRLRLESLEDRRMLATFSVSNLDDVGVGSLRQALLDASDQSGGDTINFSASLFSSPQTLHLDSALPTITDNLTLNGPGKHLLTLHAGHGNDHLPGTGDGYRLLNIDDGDPGNLLTVAIQGLTLTGGDVAGAGGAIHSRENLTITDAAIVENSTGPGTLGSFNGAGQKGGDGGRGGDGGGIFSSGGNLNILASTVSGNSTGKGGDGGDGGDGADGTNGENGGDGGNGGSGGYGGGIFSDGGDLVITNSTISGNTAGAGGQSGRAGQGGEPLLDGVGGNGGAGGDGGYGGNGGGIYSSVGEVTITQSTISGNSTGPGREGAAGGEGGLGALGGNGGDGGSGGSGGGLYSVEGQLAISRSTLAANLISNGGVGGTGATGGLDGNDGSAGSGGGVDSLGNDPVLIDNTIIAANQTLGSVPDLRTGSVTLNIDFSLIGNGDDLLISSGTGNQIGTSLAPLSPQLGPLADNGGSTQTHALLPNSATIDAGDPSIVFNASEFDQRGLPFLRVEDGNFVAGTTIDIGAYEAQAPASADFDQDNDVDGTDFLRWQRGFGTTSGAFLADGNSDDDEDVDASDLAVWGVTYGEGVPAQQSLQSEPAVASQAIVFDLAHTAFDEAESRRRKTEVSDPEFFSADTYATAFEEIAASQDSSTVAEESLTITASDKNDAAAIEFQLQDELLAILFLRVEG